ncbi:hypothetical protein BSKO_00377 [Bryopsis sp. KO-2023]|nr:hypothetical protein BSKO_00377 [Bryopsis sp. KO-2023]
MLKSCVLGTRNEVSFQTNALGVRGLRGLLPRRRCVTRAGLDPDQLSQHIPSLVHNLHLAYERVALPCSTVNCGDVIYRSTLDPALRMEQRTIEPLGLIIFAAVTSYLLATPGVLQGLVDTYVLAPLQRLRTKVYSEEDIIIGRKLAAGGFGVVYRAELVEEDGSKTDIVLKKCKEFGEAEVWMNERLMRAPGNICAEFITAFEEAGNDADDSNTLWLLWKYEGDFSLYDLMQKKEFPYNLEDALLGRQLTIPTGTFRKLVTIKLVMKQILAALERCHRSGIVHRDVKPQNCIISEQDMKIKFIDLGAGADLRVGINYVPNEFLLDPRYAPPQNYIMSTQTPKAPPAPVAALLSPVLWQLEQPDRFDMYSVGIILMQMAFPNLRSDNNLIAFNRKLESLDYDLDAWRSEVEKKGSKDIKEGFQIMDMEQGAGWDFVKKLVCYDPKRRLSASQAVRHRLLSGASSFDVIEKITGSIDEFARPVLEDLKVGEAVTGTQRVGGLTEGQLAEELGLERKAPMPERNRSATIAWWKDREAFSKKQLSKRKKN